MKILKTVLKISVSCCLMLSTHVVSAQFGGLLNKVSKAATSKGAQVLGLDKLLKEPEAITTNFDDVDRKGEQMPEFEQDAIYKPLHELSRNGKDGFILQAGHYEMTNKSYCLKAGTHAPSSGDGYMYAPTLGKKEM
ncbi:hypothetical protein OKW96_13575 [Sphingobacterium sp. KU25419]|nr:hypothetical protein OKW96_13575 [Sphingobacterium sp. KU25419]